MTGLATTGTRAAQTSSISCSAPWLVMTVCDVLFIVTKLVWPAVGDGGPLGSVDDVLELQDVDGGPGCYEQHAERDAHLVEPVQLAILDKHSGTSLPSDFKLTWVHRVVQRRMAAMIINTAGTMKVMETLEMRRFMVGSCRI